MSGFTAVAVAAMVAGCGGSSSSSPSPSPTADPALATACPDNAAIGRGFNQLFANVPQFSPESGPPSAAVKQQLKAGYDQLLAKPLADIAANPPAAIASDIRSAASAIQRSLGTTGDPTEFFSDPAFQANTTKIDLYFYDNCPGPKHDVGAVEYRFSGLPATVSSGTVNFKLTDNGKEDHELLVVTAKPGVTESFDQLLALPREQVMQKVDTAGEISITPGKSDASVFELKPGRYLALCTVAKGSVDNKPGSGPPHFTLGMKQEITVT